MINLLLFLNYLILENLSKFQIGRLLLMLSIKQLTVNPP